MLVFRMTAARRSTSAEEPENGTGSAARPHSRIVNPFTEMPRYIAFRTEAIVRK